MGEMIKQTKEVGLTPVLVSDYMAKNLITFKPHDTIFYVIESLLKNKISGAPVVNEEGELIGVISEGDCLKDVVKGKYDGGPVLTGKVKEYMSTNVMSISPEMDIFEVANLFLTKRIRRFPVVKDGKLVGQISQRDVIRAVKDF